MNLPKLETEDDYYELYDDTPRWDALIAALMHDEKIEVTQRPERLSQGTNLLYHLDERRMLKVYPDIFHEDATIERDCMRIIQRAELGLPSPALIQEGVWRGWPYMVMERFEGLRIVEHGRMTWPKQVPHEDRVHIVAQIGDWMRASHQSALFQGVSLPEKWADWEATSARFLDEVVQKHDHENLPAGWLEQIGPYFEGFDPMEFPLSNVHADLHGGNVLISDASGRWEVSCVLDFADTLHATAPYDMVPTLAWIIQGDETLAHTLYERVLDPAQRDKLHAKNMMQWLLLHRFCRLHALLTYIDCYKHHTQMSELARAITCLPD